MNRDGVWFPRLVLITGIAFVTVAVSFASSGQSNDKQFDDALAEIALLKRVVAEQDRRIADLETSVKSLQSAVAGQRSSMPGRIEPTAPTAAQVASSPWKTPSAWDRVKDGMSQAQVVAILGQPTSVEVAVIFKTLFYRGEVSGSGFVSGNVKLSDDRVWLVNKPVF